MWVRLSELRALVSQAGLRAFAGLSQVELQVGGLQAFVGLTRVGLQALQVGLLAQLEELLVELLSRALAGLLVELAELRASLVELLARVLAARGQLDYRPYINP
jgi:hypothetical protein